MRVVSRVIFACALSLSGCILLLDTEKLHSESGSGGSAGATSGVAGESGKAGKSGKGGGTGMGGGGAAGAISAGEGGGAGMGGGNGSVCLDCLAIKCATEINACNAKPACKPCFNEMNKPASCTTDPTYLSFVGCACVSCSMDCKLSCGAAGKGGG